MHHLGNPIGIMDDGATITSYLGLLLLGCSFISIGIFCSSLTSSQIVAFILAMFFCWFIYDGLNLIGSFNLLGDFDLIVRYLSASYHYESIKKGVVDTSDLIYFISVITIFIFSSISIIKSLKK
jgi:ABC-2 type transport system permease protein